MQKKVMALILVVPLIFLMTVSLMGNIGGNQCVIHVNDVQVSVSGTGDPYNESYEDYKNITINQYDYTDGAYRLNVLILPTQAKNKNYAVNCYDLDEEGRGTDGSSRIIAVDEETGGIRLLGGLGKAKIQITTADSNYSASIDVSVFTSDMTGFNVSVNDADGNPIEMTPVHEDAQWQYEIETTESDLHFGVSFTGNTKEVIWTDVTDEMGGDGHLYRTLTATGGDAAFAFSGTYFVKAEFKESKQEPVIIKITVNKVSSNGISISEVTADGSISVMADGAIDIAKSDTQQEKRFYIESDEILEQDGINLDGSGLELKEFYEITDMPAAFFARAAGHKYAYIAVISGFREIDEDDSVDIKIGEADITVSKKDVTVKLYHGNRLLGEDWDRNEIFGQILEDPIANKFSIKTYPAGADVNIDWYSPDPRFTLEISANQKACAVKVNKGANMSSSSPVTVKVSIGGAAILNEVLNVQGVTGVSEIVFEDDMPFGIKERFAVGEKVYRDGKPTDDNYVVSDKTYGRYNGKKVTENGLYEFKSANKDIVELIYDVTNGTWLFDIKNTGTAEITACWKYGGIMNRSVEKTFILDVVEGGVNIYDHKSSDLKKAAAEGHPIVLRSDIFLGVDRELSDEEKNTFSLSDSERAAWINEMPTTYDWTDYKNRNEKQPNVKYLVEFKNDVYGNGYQINADYITAPSDKPNYKNGSEFFFGPLDFVHINTENTMEGLKLDAAVRGQDDIVFLVRADNVTIDNAVLKGCRDERLYELDSDEGESHIRVNMLNHAGTVLEIMGDNTNVYNSRINNGRTVVRVYGGLAEEGELPVVTQWLNPLQVEEERITVNIQSCILSEAREFIVKTGTNRSYLNNAAMDGSGPAFAGGFESMLADKTQNAVSKDSDFYRRYVLTDLTLNNCDLISSGLFAIGVESHFAGPVLTGPAEQFDFGLKNLASTSYAAVLRLAGDVRMYNWKDLEDVDSSTLIEGNKLHDLLKLDIGEMIKNVYEKDKVKYKDIIAENEGKYMVHGGIAFYGGGRNYSRMDLSQWTTRNDEEYGGELRQFDVYLADAGTGMDTLQLASGNQPFSFFFYDANSKFDYKKEPSADRKFPAYRPSPLYPAA